jgi:hypothetical protein
LTVIIVKGVRFYCATPLPDIKPGSVLAANGSLTGRKTLQYSENTGKDSGTGAD